MNSAFVYCLRTHKYHFLSTFSLKMSLTILFTHLKFILLQYFSVFSFSFQFSAVSKQTLKLYCCSKLLTSFIFLLLQKNHPSALSSFEEIKSVAHEKQMVVFLDYDGTLSPIVNNPDQAFMSTEVSTLSKKVRTYI